MNASMSPLHSVCIVAKIATKYINPLRPEMVMENERLHNLWNISAQINVSLN
jgi:hypothetical protein